MPYRILTDEDVSRALTMRQVIAKIEDALREKAKGTLVSPPRFEVKGGKGELVFTAGAATGNEKVVGFRVYPAFRGVLQTKISWWPYSTAIAAHSRARSSAA